MEFRGIECIMCIYNGYYGYYRNSYDYYGNSHGYHGYYGNNHGYYLLGAALVTMVNMTCNTILTTVSIIA